MSEMRIFQAELAGTITRDIIWKEVEAVDETQARAMFAETHPGYRIRSIHQAHREDGPVDLGARRE